MVPIERREWTTRGDLIEPNRRLVAAKLLVGGVDDVLGLDLRTMLGRAWRRAPSAKVLVASAVEQSHRQLALLRWLRDFRFGALGDWFVDAYFFFGNISIRHQNRCYNNAKFRRVLSPVV